MDVEVRQGSNLEGTTDALLLIRASLLIPIYSGGKIGMALMVLKLRSIS